MELVPNSRIGTDGLQSTKYVNVGERGFFCCYSFQIIPWAKEILEV